jgi:DNA-directed RNA polymerase subunit RPC12/RpoP
MGVIKLNLINHSKQQFAKLIIEDANDQHKEQALLGVLNFIGGRFPAKTNEVRPERVQEQREKAQEHSQAIPSEEQKTKLKHEEEKQTNKVHQVEQVVKSHPRQLPKINGQTTLTYSIGEKFGDLMQQFEQKQQPEESNTQNGIIEVEDGKKLYQVGYNCSKCWNNGRRFMPETNKYIKCHSCGTKLKMRPATENGFPDRDEEGNYFFADEEYEEHRN